MATADVAGIRYVTALVDVAEERGCVAQAMADLKAFATVVADSIELSEILDNPTLPTDLVSNAVATIANRMGFNETSTAFLVLLARRHRLDSVDSLVEAFGRIVDERSGLARGEIVSAGPVNEAQASRIRTAVGEALGKRLELLEQRDPLLLGGIRVTVNDKVFDLSARTYLDDLKEKLLQNR